MELNSPKTRKQLNVTTSVLTDRPWNRDTARQEVLRESSHGFGSHVAAILELPLAQSLRLMAGITGGSRGQRMQDAAAATDRGATAGEIARSLRLGPLAVEAVELAHSAGHGEAAIKACAECGEFDARSARMILQRLTYSFALIAATTAALFVISVIAVDQMRNIFEGFGLELPGATQLVFWWSRLISGYPLIWLPCLVVTGVMAFLAVLQPEIRQFTRELFRWLPFAGAMVDSAARARATMALSRMMGSGAPAPLAVAVASRLSGLSSVRKNLTRLSWSLEAGELPGDGDRETLLMALPLFKAPDSTSAAQALRTLSELYAGRCDALGNVLPYILEPVAVLGVGGTVGFTVIALFMPLVRVLNDLS